MEKKYYAIMIVILIICICAFSFQINNPDTFIFINETEVSENSTINGMLCDSLGHGVPNKTITFHKPGSDDADSISTDNEGVFKIKNVKSAGNSSNDNCYYDFAFEGDNKYKNCSYGGNVTIVD